MASVFKCAPPVLLVAALLLTGPTLAAGKKEKEKASGSSASTSSSSSSSSPKVPEVGDVTFGDQTLQEGSTLKKAVYTERSSFSVSVPVRVGGEDATAVEQAAVRFIHPVSEHEVWVPLLAKDGVWSTEIDLVRHADQSFAFESGEWKVAVLVSDPSFKAGTAVLRELGTVKLDLHPTPLFTQRMQFSEMKDWVRRKPQAWDMKPAEQQASSFMALAFCGALAVPVLVLFFLLFQAGANLSGFLDHPIQGMIFHGILGVICALIVLYWLWVPLFPTLIMIGGTGSAAFVFRPRTIATHEKEKAE